MRIRDLTKKIISEWEAKWETWWETTEIFPVVRIKGEGFFTPLRPIASSTFGLDWTGQRRKILENRKELKPAYIAIKARDGKKRRMLCIPTEKLRVWWSAIDLTRTNDDRRSVIPDFMEELDGVFREENFTRVYPDSDFTLPKRRPEKQSICPLELLPLAPFMAFNREAKDLGELLIAGGVRAVMAEGDNISRFRIRDILAGTKLIGKQYYVAKDVCYLLQFSKYRAAVERISPGHIRYFPMQTPGGVQQMAFMSLGGVVELIHKSRRPNLNFLKKHIHFTKTGKSN